MSSRLRGALGTVLLAVAAPIAFLLLLEALAWSAGVQPLAEDPNYRIRDRLRTCRSDPAHLERCEPEKWRRRAAGRLSVFTLGGSSMRGHPFGERRNIPHFLRRRLESARPDGYGVFNVARACKDSFYVRRCAERLAPLEPAVLVVYTGHNDFAAFTRREPRIPIWMERSGWRLHLLARQLAKLRVASLLSWRSTRAVTEDRAPRLSVAQRERAQRIVLDQYAENLSGLIDGAARQGSAVVLVSVASNLVYPMARDRWDEVLADARSPDPAKEPWLSTYARAVELQRAARHADALEQFKRARDLAPHTRAPGILNDWIRATAARHPHVVLVDFERELERIGAAEGIGCNFFGTEEYCDGVHPNPRANRILGEALADAVLGLGLAP